MIDKHVKTTLSCFVAWYPKFIHRPGKVFILKKCVSYNVHVSWNLSYSQISEICFCKLYFFGKLVSEIIYFSSLFWYSREIWKCICMYMKLLCYSERHFTSQGSRQFFVWIPKSIECYFFTLKRQKRIWIKRLCQEKSRQCVSLIISYILSFIVNYKRGPSCLKAG